MKILVIYRPDSAHGRIVEDFIRDYQHQHEDSHIDVVNIDSREGTAMATLYDIVQYPTILATRDDGSILRAWSGETMPLMSEIAGYAYS